LSSRGTEKGVDFWLGQRRFA